MLNFFYIGPLKKKGGMRMEKKTLPGWRLVIPGLELPESYDLRETPDVVILLDKRTGKELLV
jgi:hypothetical protein